MHSQITRIRNKDGSETLKRRSDGLTLPYSGPNLTTMLTGITDPLFVLKRIDNNGTTEGSTYPYKYEARNQTEFTTASFDTVWNLLLSNPDRPIQTLTLSRNLLGYLTCRWKVIFRFVCIFSYSYCRFVVTRYLVSRYTSK